MTMDMDRLAQWSGKGCPRLTELGEVGHFYGLTNKHKLAEDDVLGVVDGVLYVWRADDLHGWEPIARFEVHSDLNGSKAVRADDFAYELGRGGVR